MTARWRALASTIAGLLVATGASVVAAAPTSTAEPLAPGCTVNELLVNSCRPWFGASANGYSEVAGDKRTQLEYFEQRTGRQMEMVHLYHGAGNASHQLDATDLHFINRPDTMVYLNWPVTNDFSTATGGNATVNGYIDQMARSIRNVAPKKLFLTIHHEPENDLSTVPGDCGYAPVGTMGTAAEYVAMWRNIRQRFDALGVNNVVWVMNYMNYPKFNCMIDDLWPGNEYVDYISFNGYQATNRDVSFEKRVAEFYDFLTATSNSTHNYLSKEWGIVEWGIHSASQANTYLYYQQAKAAVENNVFPKLRFYMVFDNGDRNRNIWDFMVAYDSAGQYDPQEQAEFNSFAGSWALTGDGTPSTGGDEQPSTPTGLSATASTSQVAVSWNASTDDNAVASYDVYRDGQLLTRTTALSYTDTGVQPGATYSYAVRAVDNAGNVSQRSGSVSATVPGGGDTTAPSATTGVRVALSSGVPRVTWSAATDNVGVTGYQVLRNGAVVATTSTLAYVDTAAPQGRRNYYRVQAVDAAGNLGALSTTVSVVVPDTTAPTAPASLTATRTSTSARLTWTPATDNVAVTGYLVFRGTTQVARVSSATRAYTVGSLRAGTTYTFQVVAVDAAGNRGPAATIRR